jgi:hypothetical protein
MKDPEDEAFEQLALRQGQWDYSGQNTSGWRKKQVQTDQLIAQKVASLENASSDMKWGFEQGALWMQQVMKARET